MKITDIRTEYIEILRDISTTNNYIEACINKFFSKGLLCPTKNKGTYEKMNFLINNLNEAKKSCTIIVCKSKDIDIVHKEEFLIKLQSFKKNLGIAINRTKICIQKLVNKNYINKYGKKYGFSPNKLSDDDEGFDIITDEEVEKNMEDERKRKKKVQDEELDDTVLIGESDGDEDDDPIEEGDIEFTEEERQEIIESNEETQRGRPTERIVIQQAPKSCDILPQAPDEEEELIKGKRKILEGIDDTNLTEEEAEEERDRLQQKVDDEFDKLHKQMKQKTTDTLKKAPHKDLMDEVSRTEAPSSPAEVSGKSNSENAKNIHNSSSKEVKSSDVPMQIIILLYVFIRINILFRMSFYF